MRVLEDDQYRLRREARQLLEQGFERQRFLAFRRNVEIGIALAGRDRQERGEQSGRPGDAIGAPTEECLELVQLDLGRVALFQVRCPLQLVENRMQGAVHVEGRTEVTQDGDRVAAHLVAKGLDQARLADPGLAGQEHDLAFAGERVGPARQQQVELFVTADQGRKAPDRRRLEATGRPARFARPIDVKRPVDPPYGAWTELVEDEQAFDQPARALADHHRARLGQVLQASGEIGGLSYDRHLVTELAGADVAGDHEAGTDADPHGNVDARRGSPGVQRLHRLDDLQARLHRPPRVVLVSAWIAEVDQNAVTDVVADVAVKSPDDLGAGALIAANHLVQIFRVHARGQSRGTDHVAEQNRELPALGLGVLRGGGVVGGLAHRLGTVVRHVRARQPGNGAPEPLAIAERDAELGQISLGQIRQHVEIDLVLGEQLRVPAKADLLEPFVQLGHRPLARFPPVPRSLDRTCCKA